MHLFTYWETPKGSKKPGYIDVCEETIWKHCSKHFTVHHLTPDNLKEFLPDLPKKISALRYNKNPAHTIVAKSDYIRAALLYEYGGVWLDSDTLVLRDFEEIFNALHNQRNDFVYCIQSAYQKKYVGTCFLGSQKQGRVITAYFKAMEELIKGKQQFKWGQLGHKLLTPMVTIQRSGCYRIAQRKVYPVEIERAGLFFKEEKRMTALINDDTLCFTLYNSLFPKKFKTLQRRQLLTGKTVISKAFRHSLGVHIL
jgi:hypothetical protein